MPDLATLIRQGSSNLWVFIPTAVALGALHGLEPGHSKTMMAAFIVAIRGTVRQAVMLGLAATFSHTAIVWAIALGGLYFGRRLNLETSEPWFQLASAAIIIGVAAWMAWRAWRDLRAQPAAHSHDHAHPHDHTPHGHAGETRRIDTGHGVVALGIFEDGAPPRFRLLAERGHGPHAEEVSVTTTRAGGARQVFAFAAADGGLESIDAIPEPHTFTARLTISQGGHDHDFDVEYSDQPHPDHEGLDVASPGFQDAHERAHADDIRRRFADRNVTTAQIIVFGLTGGLIPCPASITVLLLCLQLQQIGLGALLVLCFSVGLALTMVGVGAAAALGLRHAERRWSGTFAIVARRAPFVSAAVIALVGLLIGGQAVIALR
jgi:nickel/cobalt exporter